jgi:parallel beta-helix repeat protein
MPVKRFLLLALVFSVMVTTGPVLADSDFYVIAGGGATVGTKISSVPFIINTPGFYFFSRNLDHSGTEPAIFVNADNVTIDLMGFSLSHTAISGLGMGIALGSNNVEIRNGTIRGFYIGIFSASTSGYNHRVINIAALNPGVGTSGGNILLAGTDHLVKNCTAANCGASGIEIGSGTITGCRAFGNGAHGFIIEPGPGIFIGNMARNNRGTGFRFYSSSKIMLDQNSASDNTYNYSVGDATNTAWGTNAGR